MRVGLLTPQTLMLKKIFAPENLLNLLLIFVPLAAVLEIMHANPIAIFAASSLAAVNWAK